MPAKCQILYQIILFLLLAVVSLGLAAKEITGRVVAISDGDTLTVLDLSKTQHRIRLAGIDAPEKAQPFGTRSRQALSEYVFSKDVTVTVVDIDRYKRVVGIVLLAGTDINQQLVAEGYAWVYRQFIKKLPPGKAEAYIQAENRAKANQAGLWADKNPVPPWEWRRKK
jgi:endonuclease YncB( thermonuclease family)